ncbi:glutamate 5-kinase [Caldalkalibacillus salinus]|uniref:glutamate 5-kinase n=1 Tax=Caldalkalibacillus salinus TaxID=2803787 RepID=UPI00192461D9|nr:glutamate 5-kinase [Caldalkalibacillus salinus]
MNKKRIVVKIGSSSLTNTSGGLSLEKLHDHTEALAKLMNNGHEVVLISSGAVAAGFTSLGYPSRPVTVVGKQAAAAVGQGLLMQGYTERLAQHGITTAQLLLTRQDLMKKEHYHNVYSTLSELIQRRVLPIINENDSVSVEELTFGDNDMLSALVSGFIHADMLMMLTDVDGIYDQNPAHPEARRFHYIDHVTDELLNITSENGSKVGTGGMKSKLKAAQTATSLSVKTFIGTGQGAQKLTNILEGKGEGTYIYDKSGTDLKNHKQWIAYHSQSSGHIVIDSGAVEAIMKHSKSILPVGVSDVQGSFLQGDVVDVLNPRGELIAKGMVHYTAQGLRDIMGKPSYDIQSHDPFKAEVIHRDHLVLIKKGMNVT